MTNLERYRHKIAFCMNLGGGWGVINGVPTVCGFEDCKKCIGFNLNDSPDMACDEEKIIDWMLEEHKEESNAER